AVIVGAFDVDEIVGCATALPLVEEHEEFIAPVRAHGLDPHKTFYLAESVLRRSWRGFGTGNRFFELREQHARSLGGFERALFCGVIRPENHPARPFDHRPLDGLWRKHGYAPVDGLQANFSWRDVGDSGKTTKAMQFWMKNL
ncbi:MAG: GNAT family N-acetyltransferase, partial [Geminicoccaceae bacterium]